MKRKSRRKSKTARPDEVPTELRASTARKQVKNEQRSDTEMAMKRITTSGWDYDEETAKQMGTDDVGYYIADVRACQITPEDAFDLYSHHNYAYNRSFDQQHATHLSKSMRVAPNIDIAIGPSSKPVLVNGQHQLWAVYRSADSMPNSYSLPGASSVLVSR